MNLNVWRLHPKSVKFIKAEKTLNGTANAGGVKFCRPFTSANRLGWWMFPAVDVDICWKGGQEFEHKLLENWSDTDHVLVKSLTRPNDNIDISKFCPEHSGRTKFTWGGVEDGVVQFWTGCILETDPGWALQIRSPINFPYQGYRIMEGILETDWMQYDIWMNLVFERKNEWIQFRKDSWPPIAQIIPLRRECVDGDCTMSDRMVNRDSKEANRVFEYWLQYNDKKFGHGGNNLLSKTDPTRTKDSTTFYKERQRMLGKGNMEPKPEMLEAKEIKGCPFRTKFIKKD
jgi:hypothetical protein